AGTASVSERSCMRRHAGFLFQQAGRARRVRRLHAPAPGGARRLTMLTVNQIYKTLGALSNRYERLKKKFNDFYALAGYLSSGRSEISGISLEGHLDENYFIVAFCGQLLEFRFSITIDDNSAAKGVVSSY